jgi:hypothetical protein
MPLSEYDTPLSAALVRTLRMPVDCLSTPNFFSQSPTVCFEDSLRMLLPLMPSDSRTVALG